MKKQDVFIISPALAKANNGNWQTAQRWANFLQARYRVQCLTDWNAVTHLAPDLMIALHARHSALAIGKFAKEFPQRPLVLILTGTDLYRDIRHDEDARRSLMLATHLVVLQPRGLDELSSALLAKARVVFQSAPVLTPILKLHTPLAPNGEQVYEVIMIGHLRKEKRPDTFMQAARHVATENVVLVHIGGVLDPALGDMAAQTAATEKRYTWLGPLTHAQTRQRLRHSALMVICSEMEGGANVIIEAVTCRVPVLASDIAGNRGMLGEDYAGYFKLGDALALASLIDRAATDPAFQALLRMQCARRAELFTPGREQAAVLELADNCLLLFSGISRTGYS